MTEIREILACPICKGKLAGQTCEACNISFGKDPVASYICRQMYPSDEAYVEALRVIEFWGNGWRKRLEEPDHKFLYALDAHGLAEYADKSLDWCKANHSIMADVPRESMAGAIALNIGCGAGEEALILARGGANCIAMDITAPAAEAAQSLVQKLGHGVGMQADARFLPLKTASVDLVYSSGVLHHSPNLPKSIAEIHRVLKPGGAAYIMLYATWSIIFLQQRLARLPGEAAWETEGRTNPCTTTYSAAECRRLFAAFADVRVDKRGGSLRHVAKIGRFLPNSFDPAIDRLLGPNLNIVARKPARG